MAKSLVIPQDIIDNVIAEVGDDTRLLKLCSLVSSSFLLPSRKQLFSRITLSSDQKCQGIQQFLVQNPVIQLFVRTINITLTDTLDWTNHWRHINLEWVNGTSLLAILRLPFCRLECLSIRGRRYRSPWYWNRFSSELIDALSNIIHSSSLKTLSLGGITNLPITFFLNIVHLKTLELHFLSPNYFSDENSSSLTQGVASHAVPVIDQCVWHLSKEDSLVSYNSIFLPFLCRLRFLEIYIDLNSGDVREFDTLSLLIASLCISHTSPATLEHLKINILFCGASDNFNHITFYEDLHDADVWSHLESITTHPTGSQLQRVEVNINHAFYYVDGAGLQENDVLGAVLEALPLLRTKGILFMEVDMGDCCAKYVPGITGTT